MIHRKEIDGKIAALFNRRVGGRLAIDTDQNLRRVQTDAGERTDGHPQRGCLSLRRRNRDSTGPTRHDLFECVRLYSHIALSSPAYCLSQRSLQTTPTQDNPNRVQAVAGTAIKTDNLAPR